MKHARIDTTRIAAHEGVARKPGAPAFRAASWAKESRMILALVWTCQAVGPTGRWKLLPGLEQP